MIVSQSHRFVFFHNPKAGGSSLRKVFQTFTEDDYFRYHGFINGRFYPMSHLDGTMSLYVARQKYGDQILDYNRLMIVRDPLTRFVSAASEFAYKYHDWYKKFNLSLKDFLLEMLTPESIELPQFTWFKPQYRFCAPNTVIYPLETLSYNWKELCAYLGIGEVSLPKENGSSNRDDVLDPDDPDVADRVSYLYEEDYRWLNRMLSSGPVPSPHRYFRPVERQLKADSYFWEVRNIKRLQLGMTLGKLTGNENSIHTVNVVRTAPVDLTIPELRTNENL